MNRRGFFGRLIATAGAVIAAPVVFVASKVKRKPSNMLTFVAGTEIRAGDALYMGEDGRVYPTMDQTPIIAARYSANEGDVIFVPLGRFG